MTIYPEKLNISGEIKKLFVGGSNDKKKRKREDKTEEKNEESSVPKRNK